MLSIPLAKVTDTSGFSGAGSSPTGESSGAAAATETTGAMSAEATLTPTLATGEASIGFVAGAILAAGVVAAAGVRVPGTTVYRSITTPGPRSRLSVAEFNLA